MKSAIRVIFLLVGLFVTPLCVGAQYGLMSGVATFTAMLFAVALVSNFQAAPTERRSD